MVFLGRLPKKKSDAKAHQSLSVHILVLTRYILYLPNTDNDDDDDDCEQERQHDDQHQLPRLQVSLGRFLRDRRGRGGGCGRDQTGRYHDSDGGVKHFFQKGFVIG